MSKAPAAEAGILGEEDMLSTWSSGLLRGEFRPMGGGWYACLDAVLAGILLRLVPPYRPDCIRTGHIALPASKLLEQTPWYRSWRPDSSLPMLALWAWDLAWVRECSWTTALTWSLCDGPLWEAELAMLQTLSQDELQSLLREHHTCHAYPKGQRCWQSISAPGQKHCSYHGGSRLNPLS